jgi:hypothetical protein
MSTLSEVVADLNSEQPEGIYFEISHDFENFAKPKLYGTLYLDDKTYQFRLMED